MSEPADGERAAAVREAALRPALCPQPDTPAQGNLGKPREGSRSIYRVMGLHCVHLPSHCLLQELIPGHWQAGLTCAHGMLKKGALTGCCSWSAEFYTAQANQTIHVV